MSVQIDPHATTIAFRAAEIRLSKVLDLPSADGRMA
jgi:hypothetical protein